MKQFLMICLVIFTLISCKDAIKNTDATVEIESGTEINGNLDATSRTIKKERIEMETPYDYLLGTYVGAFKSSKDTLEYGFSDDALWVDEGFMWDRSNKINISIDSIGSTMLYGHSVVAGNSRTFQGAFKVGKNSKTVTATLKEPNDHKYDGVFKVKATQDSIKGTWQAYGDIKIKNRIYKLEKMVFKYDPSIKLSSGVVYVDWEKSKKEKDTYETSEDEDYFEEYETFLSASPKIYEINSSNKKLQKADVENLSKGDLKILRNSIFARHGYSFKNKALRVFFDSQEWYIPIYTDIRENLTDLEKENIALILKYEKNAEEFYDYFGRG